MHIKGIKIQGFKSYREEVSVQFDEGLNLLVGRNGSGKSNFFSAIRFVLSDNYNSLSREERQSLLHDGSTQGGAGGGATMSAFVEIEFDNSDGRFPTNKTTLLLRRTIGLKKDEYQLDRKSTTKGEVMSMLESAGFSRSNPYYIVPQGRITGLTNQKDADRLELLKDVAGTKVYEERRSESIKIMEETDAKKQKIIDSLEFISIRLEELESEKDDLKQFQDLDKSRRSIEYAIYQRELKDVGDALEQIEEERRRDVDDANTKRSEFNQRDKEMSELDVTIDEQKQRLEILKLEHRQYSADRRDTVKSKATVDCIINDVEDAGKKGQVDLTRLESELATIEQDIAEKETELMETEPEWEDKLKEENEARDRLEVAETTLRTLFDKQGRTKQFKTQAQRDAHLNSEISSNQDLVKIREKQEIEDSRNLDSAKASLEEITQKRRNLRNEIDGRKSLMETLSKDISSLLEEQQVLVEKRKDIWKAETKVDSSSRHATEQFKMAERTLNSTMDKATSAGLKAVKNIAQRLELDGYYGPLYELFTVEERYKTAVEVTAGSSLFHIVVDTDETASKIVDIMIKEKLGRVTMMPLNRLKHTPVEYPNAKEAIAMIKKLNFDPKYNLAFEQVFGKTIICQSLEVAGAYTRSHNLNSITLDGDKYDRKGAITGGYHDVRTSRLDAVKALKQWEKKSIEENLELREVKSTLERLDQEITIIVGKLQVAEGKLAKIKREGDPLITEALGCQREAELIKTRINRLENGVTAQQSSIKNIQLQITANQAELSTKMEQSLSTAELQQLAQLNTTVDKTKADFVALSSTRAELEGRKQILEIDLNENLRRRKVELSYQIENFDLGGEVMGGDVDISKRKKQSINYGRTIEELTTKLEEIETETEELTLEVAALEKEKEIKETAQQDDSRNIQRQQKNVERYLGKRVLLIQRKDECNKNIRDLGVLPESAFVQNNSKSEKLLKNLRKVNEKLKEFAHVNKKAYEQYTTFTKSRDDLKNRMTELETSAESIKELIDVLDLRKDEAIERTFKQVSKYFEQVFEQLVPAGKGRLIMQKRQDDPEDEMDEDDDEDNDEERPVKKGSIENYTGVAIRVSFNSKQNEGLKIQQLSGGQKALVALAMIFAIQKCDPAPFYLFDEIDANLDADRRTAVAAMINELSAKGQYICTTFRPELIPHAESCFGVFFDARKISTTKKITPEECLAFVDASSEVREDGR